MIVVSDSSALVALSAIHQLDILSRLYGKVIIPQAVWQEVVVESRGRPGGSELMRADWIQVYAPVNTTLIRVLRLNLDQGEAEAIALSVELQADLLIIDERHGRRIAREMGVEVIGVIGILIEAKRRKEIDAIKPYLDRLRDVLGFRISETLYRQVLVNEKEW